MEQIGSEVWDAVSRYYDDENNFTDDVDMYVKLAGRKKNEILELGCGTGRIVIPLAEKGHPVTGIDFSEPMLNCARIKIGKCPPQAARRITLMLGDISNFSLDRQFDVVIIAFNSLLSVPGFRRQQAVLANAWNHLKPGGKLVVSVINPDLNVFSEKVPYVKHAGSWIDSRTGREIDCFEFDYFDLANQIIYGTKLYDEIDENGIVHRTKQIFEMRYFFSYELQLLLEQQGFRLSNVYGDYDFSSYGYNSPNMIFVAVRPKV